MHSTEIQSFGNASPLTVTVIRCSHQPVSTCCRLSFSVINPAFATCAAPSRKARNLLVPIVEHLEAKESDVFLRSCWDQNRAKIKVNTVFIHQVASITTPMGCKGHNYASTRVFIPMSCPLYDVATLYSGHFKQLWTLWYDVFFDHTIAWMCNQVTGH